MPARPSSESSIKMSSVWGEPVRPVRSGAPATRVIRTIHPGVHRVAVAAGEVDIALGLDARGSGLIPAAWCGVVCIRATHGLVPAFGTVYMDHTLDFVTPITPSVEETALTLEVIAGEDERDPQWVRGPIKVDRYSENLGKSIEGLRIGVLKEAFEWRESQTDVSDAVRQGIERLRHKGAEVREVSLPLFEYGEAIWLGVGTHSVSAMIESDQEGYWRGGHCNVAWQAAFGNARRARADDLLRAAKFRLILGAYLKESYQSTYFSKAQNLRMMLGFVIRSRGPRPRRRRDRGGADCRRAGE